MLTPDYNAIIEIFERARFNAGQIARELVRAEEHMGNEQRLYFRERINDILNLMQEAAKKLGISDVGGKKK